MDKTQINGVLIVTSALGLTLQNAEAKSNMNSVKRKLVAEATLLLHANCSVQEDEIRKIQWDAYESEEIEILIQNIKLNIENSCMPIEISTLDVADNILPPGSQK